MNDLIEIRWHGRGGQGAKTASLLLADAAFNTGKYIQGFPEYGPERMGAPITAYNRISDEKITIHSNIYEPDYVVVVDDTLLDCVPTRRWVGFSFITSRTTLPTICFNSSINCDAANVPFSISRSFFSHCPVNSADFNRSNCIVAIKSTPICVGSSDFRTFRI